MGNYNFTIKMIVRKVRNDKTNPFRRKTMETSRLQSIFDIL